jgi:hypothetical protein
MADWFFDVQRTVENEGCWPNKNTRLGPTGKNEVYFPTLEEAGLPLRSDVWNQWRNEYVTRTPASLPYWENLILPEGLNHNTPADALFLLQLIF